MIPGLFPTGGESNIFMIIQTVISVLFFGLIFFFPRIMIWQADRKMKSALVDLDAYRNDAEVFFLSKITGDWDNMKKRKAEADEDETVEFENPVMDESSREKFESLRDFKFSAPTGIDPAGLVGKLEHVLDASEHKFDRFIERNAVTEDEEELADLNMAFKGVMGTHQLYKVTRHFRQLIKKTKNFQLVGLVQMMIPIYRELAESQKAATEAFVDQAPIGDSIGPLVAAKLIESDEEEVDEAAEDIIYSEEEIDGDKVHVLKSRGPGARLGKYGDALETVVEENDLEAVITVDAGAKFEGEETGSLSEGVGVMMGGPGVEKTKIEEVATDHEVPLEGIVIKQSPAEASKPMKKEIYESYKKAVDKTEEIVKEFDGEVAVIGVGNTCGVGNNREDVSGVHNRLRSYWERYEEQEEDDVSYMGMLGAMPGGDDQAELQNLKNSILWKIPR